MMLKPDTTYNPEFIYETQDLIVSAISRDFNNIDVSIAGHDSFVFEQEDPLGMAFYIFAIFETDYSSQDFTYKPDYWKYWIENRLNSEIPTPYADTELSALGLILYSLSRREIFPENAHKFIELVNEHFSETTGIYKNFLATVLVGLGVSRLMDNEEVLSKINSFINSQITKRKKNIFNDPKNLVVTYLWAKETIDNQLRDSLRIEVFNKFKQRNFLDRDIIYLAYVLLEEIRNFSRRDRQQIKSFVQESLKFIRDYTLENQFSNSSAVIGEFGGDIALEKPELWEIYGYPNKPVLSRILMSFGLLIEQKYINSPHLFDGSEQLLRKASAVVFYFGVFSALGLFFFWAWMAVDFINNFKDNFQTKEILSIALGLLKIVASTALLAIALLLTTVAVLIPYYLITNIEIKHTEAITRSLDIIRKYVGPADIGAAILINILTSLK